MLFILRCPINRDEVDPSFPRIAMELTDQEIKDYFTPRDFALGILLINSSPFVRAFYVDSLFIIMLSGYETNVVFINDRHTESVSACL